jgi:hypothetical protein
LPGRQNGRRVELRYYGGPGELIAGKQEIALVERRFDETSRYEVPQLPFAGHSALASLASRFDLWEIELRNHNLAIKPERDHLDLLLARRLAIDLLMALVESFA